jgi:hypothetical protein
MDKSKLKIQDFKNVLVTTDGDSGKTRNFLLTEKLADTSKKDGYYFNLHFDAFDIKLSVDTSFYDSLSKSEYVHKDWTYDMYFEHDGCVCHAPLYKFKPKGCGFQPKVFRGVITELDEIENSIEVNNYRQTLKKMGY